MKSFQIFKTRSSGQDTAALVPCDTVFHRVMVANTEQVVTVPTGSAVVVMSSDMEFWAGYDAAGAITVPSANSDDLKLDQTPDTRFVGSTSTISLIAASGGSITLMFYGA